jgi:parallel beta-helix repeat protein
MFKNKKTIGIVSIIILIIISVWISQRKTIQTSEELVKDEIDFTKILVSSNSDFKIYNIPGNGTTDDPYIIDDIELKYNISHIAISNTSVHIVIKNCTFSSPWEAIRIDKVKGGSLKIIGNVFDGNYLGISLSTKIKVIIAKNQFINNTIAGVACYYPTNMQLIENRFYNSGLHIMTISLYLDSIVVRDNYVNDKKLGFFGKLCNLSFTEDQEYGQLIFVGCENISIKNLNIKNTVAGIYCLYSSDISISNNTISSSDTGIRILVCENISITNNILLDNTCGLICSGVNGKILNNEIKNSRYGMGLSRSSSLVIENNVLSNNYLYGMNLFHSCNNTIRSNIVELSYIIGVNVTYESSDNMFHHNVFYKNSIQAEDHCINNMWYDPTTQHGNFWSDYDETDNYYIPGEAGAVDLYPHPVYDY